MEFGLLITSGNGVCKMTKYYCDRCGKRIYDYDGVCGVAFEEEHIVFDRVDVCVDCLRAVMLIAKRIDTPTEGEHNLL